MVYKVVGHAAHVRTETLDGKRTILLYKGSVLPPDVSPEQISHLLSVGLITGSDDGRKPASEDAGDVQPVQPVQESSGDAGLSEERKAARAKLPEDGSLPHPNASKAVWVEAAVARGHSYEAANAVEKAELVQLLRG